MNKFKNMPILYPVVVMIVICLVITAALAGTNALTEDKISKINAENEKKAMSRLLEADSYDQATVKIKSGECEYYVASKKDGTQLGYIFKIGEKGYGGTVSVMIAVDTECKVKAIELLDVTTETPGLGQNAAKADFTKQYEGKSEELTAVKFGTASGDNEIDAVASATITSRAVTKAVNEALEAAKEIKNEKGGADEADTFSDLG